MHVCYLGCHEAGLCCYLLTHIENLLRPLQLFYFHLWPIYSPSYVFILKPSLHEDFSVSFHKPWWNSIQETFINLHFNTLIFLASLTLNFKQPVSSSLLPPWLTLQPRRCKHMFLRNVGELVPNYAASHSQLWELEIHVILDLKSDNHFCLHGWILVVIIEGIPLKTHLKLQQYSAVLFS
jgi:hypothetical protein